MDFFEQEMKKLFGDSKVIRDAKYFDKTLIGNIDGELRVKLQFAATEPVADYYNALRLKIINRTDGLIDAEAFRFADILRDSPGLKKSSQETGIHIWEYRGEADWYGYHPTAEDYRKIADTINDYISMYQEESMEMNM